MTAETRAKISASHLGLKESPETREKISMAAKGRIISPETRAKLSLAMIGQKRNLGHHYHLSAEICAERSIARMGHVVSPETRAKQSAAATGPSGKHWKGGIKLTMARKNAKRRSFSFTPLNARFEGSEGHRVDNEQVIFMPKVLHRSIYHRQTDGLGMAKINVIAYGFLFRQEADADMARRAYEKTG